ncbi:MAG TPA: hypothetical protein VFV86_06510 [Nitrososphaeraceae archaeon]|nr:hypothetical protein [Nitrososphaeraceae archaeon]
MNNKNSAIFLAAVLVVGIIGMASPLIGFASANEEKYKEKRYDSHDYKKDRNYDSYDYGKEYKKDRNYDSYDSHDYKKGKKYDSYDPKYQKAECNVNNFNIGKASQFELDIFKNYLSRNGAEASTDDVTNSLGGTGPTIGMGSNEKQNYGGGDNGIELDFENICLNLGKNRNSGTVGSVP